MWGKGLISGVAILYLKCSVFKKTRYAEAKCGSYTEGKKQSIETSWGDLDFVFIQQWH